MNLKDVMLDEIRAACPDEEVNESWTPRFRGIAVTFSSTPISTFMKTVTMDVDIYTDGPDTVRADSLYAAIVARIDYRIFEADDVGHARPWAGAVDYIPEEEDAVHLSGIFNIRCFRRDLATALS